MKWLTEAQVQAAAKKERQEVLACSLEHWNQLVAATRVELRKAERDGVAFASGPCALCEHYSCRSGHCPLCKAGQCCNNRGSVWKGADRAWQKITWDRDNTKTAWTRWQTAAKVMRDLLQRLYDEGRRAKRPAAAGSKRKPKKKE